MIIWFLLCYGCRWVVVGRDVGGSMSGERVSRFLKLRILVACRVSENAAEILACTESNAMGGGFKLFLVYL